MNRLDFIRLGVGASVVTLASTLPCLGGSAGDPLEQWASRHRASITSGKDGRRLVAKPSRADLATALHELDRLADGSLICRGSQISGAISGRAFQIELAAVN